MIDQKLRPGGGCSMPSRFSVMGFGAYRERVIGPPMMIVFMMNRGGVVIPQERDRL